MGRFSSTVHCLPSQPLLESKIPFGFNGLGIYVYIIIFNGSINMTFHSNNVTMYKFHNDFYALCPIKDVCIEKNTQQTAIPSTQFVIDVVAFYGPVLVLFFLHFEC